MKVNFHAQIMGNGAQENGYVGYDNPGSCYPGDNLELGFGDHEGCK